MPAIVRPHQRYTASLRNGEPDKTEYAHSTCYTAGYLASVNAGWRSVRPVIDSVQCTLCYNCYLYCPDGTVFKVRDSEGLVQAVAVDYDFCKGCGVCAKVCPVPCIAMVDEFEAENDGASELISGLDETAPDNQVGGGEV